ncbi:MAG: flagellar biosynthetic protein FliR [Sedimentisphaerales bacterium]|nr:flagellar biosynthetic protein FliR [Sedimentisphaerales bacterium]
MALIIEKLLGVVMVLTRISAFFLVLPVFGWQSIPVRIKVAMTLLLTIFFSMLIELPSYGRQVSNIEAILLISNEAIYGLALGLVATLLFAAVKIGARIIEQQIGLNMAEILDPLTGETTQPLSSLMEMIFIILFLSANGHHLFLSIILRSYEVFPAGTIPTISILTDGIIKSSSAMLLAGLKLAAPILAAFLILMVILAVLARVVPEMNILFISLPMRVGLGFIMVIIFLPYFGSFINEFADLMGKLLPI